MTEKPAKPEKKRNIWRWHALYIPLAAVLVAAFIVDVLVLISSCEAVKCESALTVVSYILVAYLVFCVCVIYMAHCFQLGGNEDERKKTINSALSFVALFLVIVGAVDAYSTNYYIGKSEQLALEAWVGGILAIWGLLLLGQRTKNQSKQLKIQTEELENKNKQFAFQVRREMHERYKAAVASMQGSEESVRIEGIYSMHQLAVESDESVETDRYRKQIAQILCSHIRSKTQGEGYQSKHKDRPSNEIQTAIDILFRRTDSGTGLYWLDFAHKNPYFPRARLSRAYLHGANFAGAQCQRADFSSAKCQDANFSSAQCQRAVFRSAQCRKASFMEARCQRADFSFAKCYSATFANAHCQKADFTSAQFAGASFFFTKCYGASFQSAQCQSTGFGYAECQGAYFGNAQCQSANFCSAKCQGANFSLTAFQSALFNESTDFCGAYSYEPSDSLDGRIEKTTEVVTAIFGGELSKESVKAIEEAKPYAPDEWYQQMQNLINQNKGKPAFHGVLEHIATGVLKDSKEIREIAAEIRKWQW